MKVMKHRKGYKLTFDQLVARQGQEYIWLDYIFVGPKNKGAVGTSFRPVSKAEAEHRLHDLDYACELWQMAVAADRTELGLEDWWAMVIHSDGYDAVFDLSYSCQAARLLDWLDDDDIELIECTGGSRMFSQRLVAFDHKTGKGTYATLMPEVDEIYDIGLWYLVALIEGVGV